MDAQRQAILRETKRDVDVAAPHGGEELCLILPHTDLDGTYAIAERVRELIEAAEIPLLRSEGVIRVTASFGVSATTDGDKNSLIAAADAALYTASARARIAPCAVAPGRPRSGATLSRQPSRRADLACAGAGRGSRECGRGVYYAVRHGSTRRRNPRAS